MFFRIPAPPIDKADEDVSKIEGAIKKANESTGNSVNNFVADATSKTSQILMNTVKIRCGTDMCLSKDIDLKDFRCEDVDSDMCGVHEKQCKTFEGRRCSDQCTYDDTSELSTTCPTNESPASCRDHHPSCRWYNGKCQAAAVKTSEEICETKPKCTWAQVTKRGRRDNRCITDFRKTATRGCFAKCKNPSASDTYDCIQFIQKNVQNQCPATFTQLDQNDARQMDLCKTWATDHVVPRDKIDELTSNFDCGEGENCSQAPTLSETDAEIFCKTKTCIKDNGYDSVVHPIFSNEGEVLGCPEINGTQYWPFAVRPDGYKFDQSLCDSICKNSDSQEDCDEEKGCEWDEETNRCKPDLVFSGKLIIAGKGDKGLCNVVNVDMQNHAQQANETVSNTLSALDLRVIRNSMTDVAREVAQKGFDWESKEDVQKLCNSVVDASQEIRERASQDCGGSQNLQNSFTKKCMNMAKNGRAMPCTMGDVDQTNVASAVTTCLQNVFVETDVLKKTVQHVKSKSSTTNLSNTYVPNIYDAPIIKNFVDLQNVSPYTWSKITNATIVLYIATIISVGVVIVWFSSKPIAKKVSVNLGLCTLLVGVGLLLLGTVCGGAKNAFTFDKTKHKISKITSFDGYLGLSRIPTEGQYKQRYGSINEIAEACRVDENCKAWVFENDELGEDYCPMHICDPEKCFAEGGGGETDACEECCPDYCTTMYTDGDIVPEEANDCKGKPFNDCKKPCMWGGSADDGSCEYSPGAWGISKQIKRPDRKWCMTCKERKGMGYLYSSLNREDGDYFNEEKPLTDPMKSSELSCFHRVPKTMGIKYVKRDLFREDAMNMFRVGFYGIIIAVVVLMVSLVFRDSHGTVDAVPTASVTVAPAAATVAKVAGN
jgi:hypothetical protein